MLGWAFSCEKDSNNENEVSCFQVNSNDIADYQIDNKWILLGFLHTDTQLEECKPSILKEMNIEFSDYDRFHANSSCNSFEGVYSVSAPDTLVLLMINTKLIYCANDTIREWEDKYYKGLKSATNYMINGNKLTIKTTLNIDIIYKAD